MESPNSYKTFEYHVTILETFLDTFGHVNNAVYLTLFEEARWDFITKNGYGLKVIQDKQEGPVVLDVYCRYRRELKERERIVIKSHIEEIDGRFMKLRQIIQKENGELACEALYTIGFFDMVKRKLILPSDAWLTAIGVK